MAGPVLDALRPKPFRGDVLAAGVVVLTTLVAVLHLRFDDTWAEGLHLVYAAAAFLVVLTMAIRAPLESESPRPYQSILYLACFALGLLALTDLALMLGANARLDAAGTDVWVFGLLTIMMLGFATTRNSAISTLTGSLSGGLVVLALVEWIFAPHGFGAFRWMLLVLISVYGLTAVTQRDRRPRHGVALIDAAGVATVVLGVSLALPVLLTMSFAREEHGALGTAWGWELMLLAVGYGLVAYSSVDRQAGPAYLGVLNLLLFLVVAGGPSPDGASLLGWPLVLLVAAGVLLTIALRPTTPAPPPPDAGLSPAPTEPLRPY